MELDRGALPLLAVNLDMPATLLHEAIDHAEAEPGASPDVFGREEWLKHFLLDGLRYAGSRIADGQDDVSAGLRLRVISAVRFVQHGLSGFNQQPATALHRIAGIEREIEQRRRQLARIDKSGREAILEQRFDFDMLTKRRLQQLHGLHDQLIEMNFPR